MKTMIETYFKRPILFDYIVSVSICMLFFLLDYKGFFCIPQNNISFDFASDIGAIGLTISGFILTLITILVSFKSSQIVNNGKIKNNSNPFIIFLASNLYQRTIQILQRGVVSLIVISFLIYLLKLIFHKQYPTVMFFLNITGLIIILATFLRCYYVLGLILKMQNTKNNQ